MQSSISTTETDSARTDPESLKGSEGSDKRELEAFDETSNQDVKGLTAPLYGGTRQYRQQCRFDLQSEPLKVWNGKYT